MDELIQLLTSKLGIDASVASAATSKAMALIKDQAGDDLFSQIAGAIPGAGEAAESGARPVEAEATSGGGMLGAISGLASSALGGSAGDALGLASSLGDAGLDASQLSGFASTIIEFLKEKVGDDVMDQVLAKVPMLQSLVG